jgi:AcrR family transcriptional regulator
VPKIVDHDDRRAAIIEVAGRLIANFGLDAVTTRRIALESGFSNGILRYYFPGKDAVIVGAFQSIFDATNQRANEREGPKRGLTGLRTLCREIMPLDALRVQEARIAIAFWQRAALDPELASLHTSLMEEWKSQMTLRLREAQQDGEISADSSVGSLVDQLMSMMMGLQILVVLTPEAMDPFAQQAQLEEFLTRLALPARAALLPPS